MLFDWAYTSPFNCSWLRLQINWQALLAQIVLFRIRKSGSEGGKVQDSIRILGNHQRHYRTRKAKGLNITEIGRTNKENTIAQH